MTALAQAAPAAEPVTRARFVLAVVALATGGFAIGTTEFVTMGLLPQIARNRNPVTERMAFQPLPRFLRISPSSPTA